MKKHLPFLIFVMILGCQQEKEAWNPIFEDTGFDYFKTDVERSLVLLDESLQAGDKGEINTVREKIEKTRRKLLEIKDYYIPLTTIRQKVYDAERYFKLNRSETVKKLLNQSKEIMTAIDAMTKSKAFDKVIVDLDRMIEDVITSLDDGSQKEVYGKMKTLGEHINLMLSRGDLVLSGIEFDK